MEYERDLNDELSGRHWAIAARKRVNDLREETDRAIAIRQSANEGRQSANNSREPIIESRQRLNDGIIYRVKNFAREVDGHVRKTGTGYGTLSRGLEQLKTAIRPIIERVQKAAKHARKLTRGPSPSR
jgi:hypothetical protein